MKKQNKKIYNFLKKNVENKIWKTVVLLFLVFTGVAITNITPYFYGKIIDKITVGHLEETAILMIIYLSVTLIAIFLSIIESVFGEYLSWAMTSCQTAHCGRYKQHIDFGIIASPIVPYRHLPQTLRGLPADCRSLISKAAAGAAFEIRP